MFPEYLLTQIMSLRISPHPAERFMVTIVTDSTSLLHTYVQDVSEVPHGVVHLRQSSVNLVHPWVNATQTRNVEQLLEVRHHRLQGGLSGSVQHLHTHTHTYQMHILSHHQDLIFFQIYYKLTGGSRKFYIYNFCLKKKKKNPQIFV